MEADGMKIGQVAKETGVGIDAIRFYEREGLIATPARRPSGYREYTPDVVVGLRFIRRAKELGFSLKEISELLRLEGEEGATPADVREQAEAKLEDLEERIRALQQMRRALRKLIASCPGKGPLSDCSILRALAPEEKKTR
jgi:MerR family copper efflux transcriptional regulator